MWSYANVWQHWWLKASHSPASALSCCFPACKSSLLLSPVKFHNGLARALSVSPNIMKTWKPSFAAKGNSLLNPGRCWMKSTSLWTVAHLLGVGRAFLLERLIVQRSGNSLTGVVSKKELIRLSVTTYRKHDKYVRRMVCGTGEYYRRIELCLPEQLQSGHRPEKVTAAASWWTPVCQTCGRGSRWCWASRRLGCGSRWQQSLCTSLPTRHWVKVCTVLVTCCQWLTSSPNAWVENAGLVRKPLLLSLKLSIPLG